MAIGLQRKAALGDSVPAGIGDVEVDVDRPAVGIGEGHDGPDRTAYLGKDPSPVDPRRGRRSLFSDQHAVAVP